MADSPILGVTCNQYWAGLHRRFQRRASFLYRFGFRLQTAVFTPPSQIHRASPLAVMSRPIPCTWAYDLVPVSLLQHADNRAWRAYLTTILRRV